MHAILENTKAEMMITEILSTSPKDSLHALLLFNIDNLERMNQQYGRKKVDDVILCVEDKISNIFRGTDIFYRIDDEFLIFARDIKEITHVEMLAENLMQNIVPESSCPDLNFSISIGISLFPLHGRNFLSLKEKAYQAMYAAKANGKNRYRLYDAARTKKEYIEKIDKFQTKDQNIPDLKHFDEIAIQILYVDKDTISALNSILELLCIYLGFSRGSMFLTKELDPSVEKMLHYATPGYEYPEKSHTEFLIHNDFLSRLYDCYKNLTLLNTSNKTGEYSIDKYLEDHMIKDILYYPVFHGNQYIGAAVFENLTSNQIDLDDTGIIQLERQFHTIQSYFFNTVTSDKHREFVSTLKLFDNIDACTYIIDKDTFSIEFLNHKSQLAAPDVKTGDLCYKVFRNCSSPCKDCPMLKLDKQNPHSNDNSEFFNYAVRKWTKNLYSWLDCIDHNGKCIIISIDVNEFFER